MSNNKPIKLNQFRIEKNKLTVEQYQILRKTTGWDLINDVPVSIALKNDLFSIGVFDDQAIIGMGRVIGDGAIYFYIQDVAVLPEYHKQGVGSLIMDHIENYLNENTNKNSFIGLMAAKGVKEFYKKYHYLERPSDRPGMYKIMKNSEE